MPRHNTIYAGPWESSLVNNAIPRGGWVRPLMSGGDLKITPKASGSGYFYMATDGDRWVLGYGETRLRSDAKREAEKLASAAHRS